MRIAVLGRSAKHQLMKIHLSWPSPKEGACRNMKTVNRSMFFIPEVLG